MPISQTLLPEMEMEFATTRKCLERVPDAHLGFKPHERSSSAGDLVGHLAQMPQWGVLTFDRDELDIEPVGGPAYVRGPVTSVAEELKTFDERVAEFKERVLQADDATFLKPWTLLKGGKVVLTLPKIVVHRSFVMNHMIHHRGQLTVYLRMMGEKVPSLYGPSADEAPF
ncbi:MAG: DinB family protein [Acidobacteriota bacterium]